MPKFAACPYNRDLPFFYFSDLEEYEEKLKEHKEIDEQKNGCHDYEHWIQFIDGNETECSFYGKREEISCCEIYDLFEIYEQFEALSDDEKIAYEYIKEYLSYGNGELTMIEKAKDIIAIKCKPADYAYDLLNETSDIPEHIRFYIDYEKYARDLIIEGDVDEYKGYTIVGLQGI